MNHKQIRQFHRFLTDHKARIKFLTNYINNKFNSCIGVGLQDYLASMSTYCVIVQAFDWFKTTEKLIFGMTWILNGQNCKEEKLLGRLRNAKEKDELQIQEDVLQILEGKTYNL